MNAFVQALKRIVTIFNTEDINYMIVGGFAVNYYNRGRTTFDIDIVIQVYPNQLEKIIQHLPDWLPHIEAFKDNAERGIVFNLIDFETGIKFDFMLYQDSDYNWTAFERRKKVDFMGVECTIAAPEDLIISKLIWYNISKSEKQLGDINFLLEEENLDKLYIETWATKLNLKRNGLF